MFEVEVVIVGAGVVGLAIAREASARGHETLVLDAHLSAGQGISSRNSEVIHAGVYYPSGSLKAFHCVRGRRLLYDYCQQKNVPFRKTGKLIVATEPIEEVKLEAIASAAVANGVVGEDSLTFLTASEARALEPELHCTAALLSPSTGILDSHSFVRQLMTDAAKSGAEFSFGTRVDMIEPGSVHRLKGISHGEHFEVSARYLFMAAGLHTAAICRAAGLQAPPDYWLKGNYFALGPLSPFQRLVYPIPVEGGLGIHMTIDMAGHARFGPDTQETDTEQYAVDETRVMDFEDSIRRYWPGLPKDALLPGYAGIRPKLKSAPGATADFVIDGPAQLGVEGLVALHGIESPGLTASLSLGEAAYIEMFGGEFRCLA